MDINQRDHDGNTALELATSIRNQIIIKLLEENGDDHLSYAQSILSNKN